MRGKLILLLLMVVVELGLRSPASGDSGFVPLFDGSSLKGWTALPGGIWEVVDGAIVGSQEATEARHGILLSDAQYGDFVVRLKYKSLAGNSGLYFRAAKVDDAVAVKGFQAEIDAEGHDVGGIYETLGRAWVVQPTPADVAKYYRNKQWNEMTVSAIAGDVTVTVNGIKTASIKNDAGARRGHFGLQLHGGQKMHVLFKDIEIQELPERTPIDDYVAKPDASYRWKIVSSTKSEGLTTIVVDMVSQTWRTAEEINRPEWQHWMTMCVPDEVKSDCGFLMIGGGSNGREPPTRADEMVRQIALATGTVVTELKMVPNQPVILNNDGISRVEDDFIGYTWDKYLETGDATWPARNPMVKSAVRAMDTITAVMASEDGGKRRVERFVVAGGSKRGWTTWLTGAVDSRVIGIVPIVIDVLNTDVSMRHHFATYGFWAPAVGNYVQHRIMERMDHPRLPSLYEMVDPYYYRHRLTMPKLILNSAGDQFFLPDSSQFYWDDLVGPKYLRYVPNSDHGLNRTDAIESIVAFYSLLLAGRNGPQYSWVIDNDTLVVQSQEAPKQVHLWQATNPLARDFRLETLGAKYDSQEIQPDADGKYRVALAEPEEGWRAYFVELTYDVGAPVPLKLTTGVQVVPDVKPFAEKSNNLPSTVTVVCQVPDGVPGENIADEVRRLVSAGVFPVKGLVIEQVDATCFFNWQPTPEEFEKEAGGLSKFLKDKGCTQLQYQLESGPGPTISPGLQREAVGQ